MRFRAGQAVVVAAALLGSLVSATSVAAANDGAGLEVLSERLDATSPDDTTTDHDEGLPQEEDSMPNDASTAGLAEAPLEGEEESPGEPLHGGLGGTEEPAELGAGSEDSVGSVEEPTFDAIWESGAVVPSRVSVVLDGDDVELLTFAPEDQSSFLALLVIEGEEAATEFRFEDAVPVGFAAALEPGGSVTFTDSDGNAAGGIAAPWAFDADGTEVPTSYSLDGDTLVQTVQHQGAVYPVLADPSWWERTLAAATVVTAAVAVACGPVVSCPASVTIGAAVLTAVGVGAAVYTLAPRSGSPDHNKARPTNRCNIRNRRGC